MTQHAFDRGDWQAVIDVHRLESHDPLQWLSYCISQLRTLQPGPDAVKQHQQAALAFLPAQREGPNAGSVAVAQRQVMMAILHQAMELAQLVASAPPEPQLELLR